ncbi:hypothetical protein HBB16_16275 [Pseudonocardia sp. MCCB 268]|nr:hypothetical protein [Pseudonocardia cytotoxica]
MPAAAPRSRRRRNGVLRSRRRPDAVRWSAVLWSCGFSPPRPHRLSGRAGRAPRHVLRAPGNVGGRGSGRPTRRTAPTSAGIAHEDRNRSVTDMRAGTTARATSGRPARSAVISR